MENIESNLLEACKNGFQNDVLRCLKKSFQNKCVDEDLSIRDEYGNTPLLLASHRGHYGIIRILLKKGAEINVKNNNGETPIIISSSINNKDITKLLLKKGAEINITDKDGNTPLMLALQESDEDVFNLLIKKEVNINIQNNDGDTPLLFASRKGNYGIIRILLKMGAKVNIQNNVGDTPFLIASSRNHKDIAKILLEKGADINIQNKDRDTPLLLASRRGHYDIIGFLLEKGANINIQDKDGDTPLLLASRKATSHMGYYEIIRLLLKNGADINIKNNNGNTSLHVVLMHDNYNTVLLYSLKMIVKYLLQYGAYVNAINNNRETPLLLAAQNGDCEISVLLKSGGGILNIDLTDKLISKNETLFDKGFTDAIQLIKSRSIVGIDSIREAIRIRSGKTTVDFYKPGKRVIVDEQKFYYLNKKILKLAKNKELQRNPYESGELISALIEFLNREDIATLEKEIYKKGGIDQGQIFLLLYLELTCLIKNDFNKLKFLINNNYNVLYYSVINEIHKKEPSNNSTYLQSINTKKCTKCNQQTEDYRTQCPSCGTGSFLQAENDDIILWSQLAESLNGDVTSLSAYMIFSKIIDAYKEDASILNVLKDAMRKNTKMSLNEIESFVDAAEKYCMRYS